MLAVVVFFRVTFAETVSATRSPGLKPVARTDTGEIDVKPIRAVLLEATAPTGSSAAKTKNVSANLTTAFVPTRARSNLAQDDGGPARAGPPST